VVSWFFLSHDFSLDLFIHSFINIPEYITCHLNNKLAADRICQSWQTDCLPVSLTNSVLNGSKPNTSPVDNAANLTKVCLRSVDHAMTGGEWSGEPMKSPQCRPVTCVTGIALTNTDSINQPTNHPTNASFSWKEHK